MKKQAIVTLGNERGRYRDGVERLRQSLAGRFDGDFLGFKSEDEVGAPKHQDCNYGFKLYAIEAARSMGYQQILWLDSSVYAVAPVQPVFDIIERKGYFAQNSGNYLGNWSSDRLLWEWGVTRDVAMSILMFNGGMVGLDFNRGHSRYFFDEWKRSMNEGLFQGRWDNKDKTESQDERCLGSRHDMSSGSIIAWVENWKYEPGDCYFQYAAPGDKPNNDTICFYLQGM